MPDQCRVCGGNPIGCNYPGMCGLVWISCPVCGGESLWDKVDAADMKMCVQIALRQAQGGG